MNLGMAHGGTSGVARIPFSTGTIRLLLNDITNEDGRATVFYSIGEVMSYTHEKSQLNALVPVRGGCGEIRES